MAVWIVVFLLVLGAGVIIWLRRHAPEDISPTQRPTSYRDRDIPLKPMRPQLERLAEGRRYWGVRIRHGEGAGCDAAIRCANECYAFEEAPPLPLPDCTAMHCSCYYEGIEERRLSPPRRKQHDRRDKIRYEPTRKSRRALADRRKLNKSWTDQSSQ